VLKRRISRKLPAAKAESSRSAMGAGIIGMSLICGLVIIPMLAVFSFEISRLYLAKQQLQNATDAAVLAATAQLASSNSASPTTAHTNAIQAALAIFQKNVVLGTQLTNSSTVTAAADLTPVPGEGLLFFTFIDPVTKLVVPISSPNGKIVNLQSAYSTYFAFGKYLSVSTFTVNALAKGAVPILDIEICYDVSGSMDDQTPITFVLRQWDSTLNSLSPNASQPPGRITYTIPNVTTTPNGKAEGLIYNILQPSPTGTSLNAINPQLFEESSDLVDPGYGQNLDFTGDIGSNLRSLGGWTATANGLDDDAGQPPGNYGGALYTSPNGNKPPNYTDVVVNIDGNTVFGGKVVTTALGTFNFPDLPTLVEAARGNLENSTVFVNSGANTSVSVSPKSGYMQAYLTGVAPLLQPIANSQAATLLFADILNTDTDCHFGMVAFDDVIGTAGSPYVVVSGGNSYEQWNTFDIYQPYGQNYNYPLPLIALNPALAQTNYSTVVTGIQSTQAMGGTNIGAALQQAVTDLQTNGRQGSVKAIVLFTDGEPTTPDPTTGAVNARAAAVAASNAGIPIYTIGLAQTAAIEPGEIAILNDTNSNPSTGGIAAISGHGATFDLVTDSSALQATFEKIARRLVELVASSSGDY
jgi:hypothetical protein